MKIIDNTIYYTLSDVAIYCNRTSQTIMNWDKFSNHMEAEGRKRLIPKAKRISNIRYYTEAQKDYIINLSQNFPANIMTQYNRKRQGKRGKEMQERMEEKQKKEIENILDKVSRGNKK